MSTNDSTPCDATSLNIESIEFDTNAHIVVSIVKYRFPDPVEWGGSSKKRKCVAEHTTNEVVPPELYTGRANFLNHGKKEIREP